MKSFPKMDQENDYMPALIRVFTSGFCGGTADTGKDVDITFSLGCTLDVIPQVYYCCDREKMPRIEHRTHWPWG